MEKFKVLANISCRIAGRVVKHRAGDVVLPGQIEPWVRQAGLVVPFVAPQVSIPAKVAAGSIPIAVKAVKAVVEKIVEEKEDKTPPANKGILGEEEVAVETGELEKEPRKKKSLVEKLHDDDDSPRGTQTKRTRK